MTVNLKCDKMFDTMCLLGEVTGKFCYSHVFLEKFANVRQNVILILRLGHTGEWICNGRQTDKNVQNLVIR